ncbi:MAG: lamin tail domain-containing protein, partial [Candidatus Nealsonbacteria bacterium]|nr:lamin tail domain-containing protein [Candidatus Nealsonbacteria bacterium]
MDRFGRTVKAPRQSRRLQFEPLEPRQLLSADSTVVFNEIMYRPAGDEELEWIELHNQMAVDMDLSDWKLDGGIDYQFAVGTIVPGGGYLVVAAEPGRLAAATGFADALGPYDGRLSNGGDRLDLVNNSDRVMDTLRYNDSEPWPVTPDGSGTSAAKIDPNTTSGPAEHWTASEQLGGTPGARNFLDLFSPPAVTTVVPMDATWKYNASGTDLGTAWRAPGFDDDGWASDAAIFFAGEGGAAGAQVSARLTADNYFAFYVGHADGSNMRLVGQDTVSDWQSAEDFNVEITPDDHIYLAGWEAVGDSGSPQMIIGQFELPDGTILGTDTSKFEYVLGPTNATHGALPPAVGNVQSLVEGANLAASWAPPQAQSDKSAAPWGNAVGTLFDNEAKFLWADTLFDANSVTNQRETFALFRSVEPLVPPGGDTQLPLGPTTHYFRTEFDFNDAIARTELWLDTLVDDGAVFYLNGTEVHRQNLPDGTVTYSTLADEPVDELTFSRGNRLSVDDLVLGANVLAVEVHQAVAADQDMTFGAELTTKVHAPDPQAIGATLTFNEVAAADASPFWLELINTTGAPLDLAGYVVATSTGNEYVLPAQSLPSGGLLPLDESQLGFDASSGNKLFLFTPDRGTVLDGVEVENTLRGRSPDGSGPWRFPDAATAGAANHFTLHDEIVINEIMYHHRPLTPVGEPVQESPEEWIELYNRSGAPVDLTGWQLADGVDYDFAPGTTIPAGGYLVVARDAAALQAKYPAVTTIVGNLTRRLDNTSDSIVLRDALGNPVDELRYYDGGRWPEFADGGGSSMELRNPWADNSIAEAWAPSDEGSHSSWQTYTYTGIAQSSRVGPDGQWHEFVLGLLDDGEVLLDDISVIESPAGSAIQLIQNGTFESGSTAWRIIGNHRHSEVIVDPNNAGNHVLRLVATGMTEHMHNHAETTLKNGGSYVSIKNGTTYEISFKAKWIGGSNQLNTRLYFNRLPKTTLVAQPELHGTPGSVNSTYATNVGPTYPQFGHETPVPDPFEPVTVSVVAEDPDGVAEMTLWYSIASGAFVSAAMTDVGDGLFEGVIPGQPASTVVQFYVEGRDTLGLTSTFPADGSESRALVKFNDGLAATNGLHNFRIIMTPADTAWFHTDVNLMSNDPVGATVIYNEREIFYDVGVRGKGSERGRVTQPRLGFGVYFHSEQLFRGVHGSVLVDRSEGVGFGQREMLINQTMNRAGSVSGEYNDLAHVIAPRPDHTGAAELQMARFGNVLLGSQFDADGDGMLFEYELIYYPTSTNNGSPEGLKRPYPDGTRGTGVNGLGNDQENYRYNFIIKNNRERDDYDRIIEFTKAFGLSGSAFRDEIDQYIDVDQWLRGFAFATLSGAGDNYAQGAQHNAQFYIRPIDGRVLYFPHDLDAFHSATRPVVGNGDLQKLIAVPAYKRL